LTCVRLLKSKVLWRSVESGEAYLFIFVEY